MDIWVLGLNHKTAPVELRERLSVPPHRTLEWLKALESRGIFEERLLLSTCNRTEIYGAGPRSSAAVHDAKRFLSEYAKLELADLEGRLYALKQPYSVEHLFSVASGLDSMVVGETEIIGQVKDAYRAALGCGQTGKFLNTLFQRSLRVAKHLRTRTGIGTGKVSVASVAVDLAEKIFESLEGKRVLVLGTGEASTQVMRAMVSRGARALVTSRHHHDRAQEIAAELGAEAIPFERYEEHVREIDVLVSATHAPCAFIVPPQVRGWMRLRHERPLFLIDIAVPRNIDSTVDRLDNVYLYNIDDLKKIADENRAHRQGQLEECSRLVQGQTQLFMSWLESQDRSSFVVP